MAISPIGGEESHRGGGGARICSRVANRVVYSAHDYPSSIYPQPWLSNADYPGKLQRHLGFDWGYIARTEIAPVVMGEFGTKAEDESDTSGSTTLIYVSRR